MKIVDKLYPNPILNADRAVGRTVLAIAGLLGLYYTLDAFNKTQQSTIEQTTARSSLLQNPDILTFGSDNNGQSKEIPHTKTWAIMTPGALIQSNPGVEDNQYFAGTGGIREPRLVEDTKDRREVPNSGGDGFRVFAKVIVLKPQRFSGEAWVSTEYLRGGFPNLRLSDVYRGGSDILNPAQMLYFVPDSVYLSKPVASDGRTIGWGMVVMADNVFITVALAGDLENLALIPKEQAITQKANHPH